MPRPALRQPHHGQPPALDQSVFGQRLHRVLAAGRHEPTRRQPHRRHVGAVQLDHEDRRAGRQPPQSRQAAVIVVPSARSRARVNPERNSCSSRAEIAYRLPGSARSRSGRRRPTRSPATARHDVTAAPPDAAAPPIPPTYSPPNRFAGRCLPRSAARERRDRARRRVFRSSPWTRTPPTASSGIAPEAPPWLSEPTQAVSCPPALTPPVGHDRAPGAGPHPKPESVHSRTPAVVRLESPLALGHGIISSYVWHLVGSRIV